MRVRIVVVTLGLLAMMGACGSDEADDTSSPVTVGGGTGRPGGETGRPDCAKGKPCNVTRQQFGAQWPYTVDRGVLTCEIVAPSGDPIFDSRQALLLEANGATYALNLPAMRVAAEKGWRPATDIVPDSGPSETAFLLFGLRTCA